MSRQYKNIIYTKQLSREECKTCLAEIINILRVTQILEIEMLFGFAWGTDYKDWTPFKVPIDNIMTELDKAEKSGAGSFFNDDTFFNFPELDCEILFCHEYDIHLEFDQPNMVVNTIIEAWKKRDIIHLVKKR
ncbi:MAG TPA: hypothetical protein VGN00_11940 [Puia sp.]|jgi:hypothetical protein